MQDPNNLAVYQRALDFAVRCARLARKLRSREAPGLAAQLTRAACSVPANVSEGVGQPSVRICARHLGVAIGSLNECETHLRIIRELAPRVGDIAPLVEEARQIRRMLFALRLHYLRRAEQS